MKTLTLEQARHAISVGDIVSVSLRPLSSVFALEFETHGGPATLIASVSKQVRRFGNPVKAFELVRDLGLEGGRFSLVGWQPQQREFARPARPDKAATLKAAHEAAGLMRILEERVSLADSAAASWHDAEDVFDELETANAG